MEGCCGKESQLEWRMNWGGLMHKCKYHLRGVFSTSLFQGVRTETPILRSLFNNLQIVMISLMNRCEIIRINHYKLSKTYKTHCNANNFTLLLLTIFPLHQSQSTLNPDYQYNPIHNTINQSNKYRLHRMSNKHIGMKVHRNWKTSPQKLKTTNSLIIEDIYQFKQSCSEHVNPHYLQNQYFHPEAHIQRHSSEDDFKKKFSKVKFTFLGLPMLTEEEYYPDTNSMSPNKRNQKGRDFKAKIFTASNKEKPVRNLHAVKRNPFKETSSTQSAEVLKNKIQSSIHAPSLISSEGAKQQVKSTDMPYFLPTHYYLARSQRQLSRKLKLESHHSLKRENFKIISKLGEGKFGKVFMVKEIHTGFVMAMKIVEKKRIMNDGFLDQFIRELKIQSFLNHPNIISVYGLMTDETHFYTLMELGCDGQLYSLISNKKKITEEAASFVIKNILEATCYIHDHMVLHRDIKPENIVFIMGNVKLCDFGWAVQKMHPGDLRNTFCGTPLYLSPEILQGNKYDEKVDLWAVGILAFELIFGCSPFTICHETDFQKIIYENISFPSEASEEFKEFIEAMLTKNPQERLTSKKLLALDFITKYEEFETCEQLCR